MLKDYKDQRPEGVSAAPHERSWEHAYALMAEIAKIREQLTADADVLAEVSGVSKLH